jgi:hypothetical protein
VTRSRRSPKPELAALIERVVTAAAGVGERERELDGAREELADRLRAAREAGLSLTLLAELTGLSRQRVGQIVRDER